MAKERIGFIGLGNMGGPMAAHIRRGGYELTVSDPNPATHARFSELGAKVVSSAKEVADASDIVFACLPSPKVSVETAKIIAGCPSAKIYVETSTIGSVVAGEIDTIVSNKGRVFFDAPISGGVPGAEKGTLTTVCSGPRAALEQLEPLFRCYSKNIFYMGDKPGQAQIAKVINNYLSTAGKVVAMEGAVMGAKAGLDVVKLIDFINVSTGRNAATLEKFPDAILPRTFKLGGGTGGSMKIPLKDMELFLEEANLLDTPLWVASQVLQVHVDAAEHGYKDKESLRMIEYIEGLAGVQITPTPGPKSAK